jgi:hypothetical protein
MNSFRIIPVLGRKVDVLADDESLIIMNNNGDGYAHDVGGINFDLHRKKNACTKSYGHNKLTSAANAQATKCLGLFELYDGTNRDWITFDNGLVYALQSDLTQTELTAATPLTFANDNKDLYSMIRVGSYIVWADRAENVPYKWSNGDANITELIDASGSSGYTDYKFRYLNYFQRRIVGLHSAETNGDIDIRWTDSLPDLSSSVEFPAANQLYAPNDDPISGARKMGEDRLFVYGENSINQMLYYPDYTTPFRISTVVPKQGFVNHAGIISLGNRHFGFNKNYGFCEYHGGNEFPANGKPLSENIESDVMDISTLYYDLIQGAFWPLTRELVWTVPAGSSYTPTQLWFYNLDTGQWRFEDKPMRYISDWIIGPNFTWNDLITTLGGTGALWSAAGDNTWAFYLAERQQLAYSNTDGHVYYQTSEGLEGSDLDGYRIEPILHFGDRVREDTINEIWFDIGNTSSTFTIDVYHRSGNTAGELLASSWGSAIGTVSVDSPSIPVLDPYPNKLARLHQIKWGTPLKEEKFQVSGITFKYQKGGTR